MKTIIDYMTNEDYDRYNELLNLAYERKSEAKINQLRKVNSQNK